MPRESHTLDGEVIARSARNTAAAAIILAAAFSASAQTTATPDPDDYIRYQAILEKNIFGKTPQILIADDFTFLDDASTLVEGEVPNLADLVRLVALTKFQGKPAAGLVDKRTGKSAYLLEGQSMGDFKLESVFFNDDNPGVIVSKGALTNEILMTFAPGNPAKFTSSDDSEYLSVLDVRKNSSSSGTALAAAETDLPDDDDSVFGDDTSTNAPPVAVAATTAVPPALGASEFTAAEIAAATIIDENGVPRISYTKLAGIRAQRERDRVEAERIEQEARLAAERARREQLARAETERAEAAKVAAETKRRRDVIDALKAGNVNVVLDFELSDAEKRELAQAGYDVPGFNDDEPAATTTAPATAVAEEPSLENTIILVTDDEE